MEDVFNGKTSFIILEEMPLNILYNSSKTLNLYDELK